MFEKLVSENTCGLRSCCESLGLNEKEFSRFAGFFSQHFQQAADKEGVMSGRTQNDDGKKIVSGRVGLRLTSCPKEAVEKWDTNLVSEMSKEREGGGGAER